jgi:uncharacterized protein YllA (UPF0747 family)
VNLVTVPFSRLDPGNALARDYCVEPEKVLPLFRHDYRDPGGFRELAERQSSRARPKLGAILEEYNRDVGGDAARAARIDDELCVVSGQQVGLLLGPAYTTYKLFTVVNAARRLERELGRPVTPVFWVESEDHDWDEVNRFFWKGQRYRIEGAATGNSVAHIDVDAEAFLNQMRTALGREDSAAWDVVAPEPSVARWHVRNLARLVPNVVFLEPRLLREPMREFAERIAGESAAIDASIQRDTGYSPRLSPPKGAYLFDSARGRTRVERGAPCPERWSTDVASRVLVQNAALPVLAAVCGSAEIDYWSQLGPAHDHFDVPMPAVLPRDAATIIESGVAKDAARLDLDLEELVLGTAKPVTLETSDPVTERLRALAGEASELFGAVESGALDLPPNAEKPFRRTVGRLGDDLEKLAARLEDARAEAAGAGSRRFEKVQEELRPRGGLQERTHSLFPYLLRHGPELADQLRDAFDPFEIGHYLVAL